MVAHEIKTKFLLFILITLFHLAAEKLEQAENQLAHSRIGPLGPPRKKEVSIIFVNCMVLSSYLEDNFILSLNAMWIPLMQEESQLAKITRDSAKITVEQVHGLMSQVTSCSRFLEILNLILKTYASIS